MPEPRKSDRSHVPIVATWGIEEVGSPESKSRITIESIVIERAERPSAN